MARPLIEQIGTVIARIEHDLDDLRDLCESLERERADEEGRAESLSADLPGRGA